MIRIFNRYISIRNTLYFVFENAFILLFLMWGTVVGTGRANLILVPLVYQICLYYNELRLPFPRFSLKEFWVRHLQVIFWATVILFMIYMMIPFPVWGSLAARLICFPFILIGLRLGYQVLAATRRWDTTLLIIGSGPIAGLLKETLSDDPSFGYRVLHFQWDPTDPDAVGKQRERMTEAVSKYKIKKVIVALNDRRGSLPVESLLHLRVQGVEILEAISFYEKISGKILVPYLKPSNLIFSEGFKRFNLIRISKRAMDLVLAFIGLALALPLFLLLPIWIKLDSRGPVFFRQERVGEQGRPFILMKFRSMRLDAEAVSGPVWASKNDPRVTRLGKILRALRLDELPQLINVLRGEMSFVGPRPERPVFVELLRRNIPYYDLRFTVKPGLTGWAQVKYHYGSTEEDAVEKLQYDLYYAKHLSLFFDLTIVIETIKVVLTSQGAR